PRVLMAISVLSRAIERASKSRNKGLVLWDAERRFNSYLCQCAVGFGGLCWRLDYHCVTARCRSGPGGDNVERLGAGLCGQPGLEPATRRGPGHGRKSAPCKLSRAAHGHRDGTIWL